VVAPRAHGEHALAAGRRGVGGIPRFVAGGHHHRGATRDGAVDRFLGHRIVGARTAAAEAEVDDLGGVVVVGHAVDMAAGSPDDGIGDIRSGAAAMTEYAHRLDLGAVGDAGDAEVVVGYRGNVARHVRAVPGAVGRGKTAPAGHAGIDPVTGVVGVRVAAVAVAGHVRILLAVLDLAVVADGVVARHDVGVEVFVIDIAGVDHGHHHALAVAGVPGLLRIHA